MEFEVGVQLRRHRRERNPRVIDVVTARTGDRFFYWLELLDIDPSMVTSPTQFQTKKLSIQANLPSGGNTIRVTNYPGKQAWIWLRPDMVNFAEPVEVLLVRGKKLRVNVTAENSILLEDVRTRADRQAPFYARISTR